MDKQYILPACSLLWINCSCIINIVFYRLTVLHGVKLETIFCLVLMIAILIFISLSMERYVCTTSSYMFLMLTVFEVCSLSYQVSFLLITCKLWPKHAGHKGWGKFFNLQYWPKKLVLWLIVIVLLSREMEKPFILPRKISKKLNRMRTLWYIEFFIIFHWNKLPCIFSFSVIALYQIWSQGQHF